MGGPDGLAGGSKRRQTEKEASTAGTHQQQDEEFRVKRRREQSITRESGSSKLLIEEWKLRVDEEEVLRLCRSMVRSLGAPAAIAALDFFRELDEGSPVSVAKLEPRELRKKIRHLCDAYTMSQVDMECIPGAKPVVLSYRKPEDCPLKLARSLKPHLKEAVSVEARLAADAEHNRPSEAGADPPDGGGRLQTFHETVAAHLEIPLLEEQPEPAAEAADEAAPEKDVNRLLSLEDYRRLKAEGATSRTGYTRGAEETAACEKSLMELTKEGAFAESKQAAARFMELKAKTEGLWGKSQMQQRKHELEMNRKETRRREKEAGAARDSADEDGEPWQRFDREKLFEQLNSRQASKKDFENLLELTSERKAAFTAPRLEEGNLQ